MGTRNVGKLCFLIVPQIREQGDCWLYIRDSIEIEDSAVNRGASSQLLSSVWDGERDYKTHIS